MSRRNPSPSRTSRNVVLFLLLIIAALSAALWFEHRRSDILVARSRDETPATVSHRTPRNYQTPPPGAPVTATLYFARVTDGKLRMIPVERELPPGLGVARASLQELIEGDVPAGCERPLPPGAKLLGITVADGLASADFSQELVSGFRGGSDNEGVTVFAIVNTLTSLPTVDRVRILVQGEPITTIGGHLDLTVPLKYDGELVVQ